MIITLANNKSISIRLLEKDDQNLLLQYLQALSAESRSRFGPHPFDEASINAICSHLPGDTSRFIAVEMLTGRIIAYMLIKLGMIEWDEQRYAAQRLHFDSNKTVTFAPSVADDWQSSGLGSIMYSIIEADQQAKGIETIILWGGVQATNQKAVGFYTKFGFRTAGAFWHNEKDNYDMLKTIKEV